MKFEKNGSLDAPVAKYCSLIFWVVFSRDQLNLNSLLNFQGQGQRRVLPCTLFHFISENKIIHISVYFIETRQVDLVQESANYGNATKKKDELQTRSAPTLK